MSDTGLSERIRLMTAHCAARGAVPGAYWKTLSERLSRQASQLSAEDAWYSTRTHYAASFSGAPVNGGSELAAECERGWPYFLSKKVENALMRLPLRDPLTDALFRWTQKKLRLHHYLVESRIMYSYLVQSLHALLRDEIEKHDLRSPAGYGPDLIDCGGRKLSYATLRGFLHFLRFQELLEPSSKHFVEIGAGVGELARIFLATGRAHRYVIVDIPPTLAYSERLMLEQFPPEKLGLFDPERGPIDFAAPQVCYFLTPDQVSLLPRFDAGINIASFGEMTKGIVSSYVAALRKAGFAEFLSLNHRLAKDHNADSIGEADYASWFGPSHELRGRWSYPGGCPVLTLPPDAPGVQGYQLLHFKA